MVTPSFPAMRMRRGRSTPWIRDMLAEHRLHPSDLIWPLFICEGQGQEEPISTLPGVRPDGGYSTLLDAGLGNGVLFGAMAICLLRGALVRSERVAWIALVEQDLARRKDGALAGEGEQLQLRRIDLGEERDLAQEFHFLVDGHVGL